MRQRPSRYSIRAGRNLPDKEFRYLRTVIVTAAVHRGLSSLLRLRLQVPLTFRHWAGVSSYTSSYDLAETCVFDKQSLGPLHCGHIAVAPLLPKLRGHFAEFLNKSSPVRLRIFFSSTCVGLRYGYLIIFSSFSRRCRFMRFPSLVRSPFTDLPFDLRTSLQAGLSAWTRFSIRALALSPRVTASLSYSVVQDFQPVVHHLRLSAST